MLSISTVKTLATHIIACAFVAYSSPLHAGTPASCAASKAKAAGKKANATLKCAATALAKGTGIDPICTGKAQDKFSTAFTKIETKGGCAVGDATAVGNAVDNLTTIVIQNVTPGVCGNGFVEGAEDCDGTDFAFPFYTSCADLGYAGGALACRPDCTVDDSCCHNFSGACSGTLDADGGGGTTFTATLSATSSGITAEADFADCGGGTPCHLSAVGPVTCSSHGPIVGLGTSAVGTFTAVIQSHGSSAGGTYDTTGGHGTWRASCAP